MKLTLKTITPLHIGSGDKLSAIDYFIHEGVYYKVPQQCFSDFLETIPDGFNRFADWMQEQINEINNLVIQETEVEVAGAEDYNQRKTRLEKELNLLKFVNTIDTQEAFLIFCKNNPKVFKGTAPNVVEGQIHSYIKSGDNRPYVPGSSIKGAIRTALLYHHLTNYCSAEEVATSVWEHLDWMKRKFRRGVHRKDTMAARRINQDAFICERMERRKDGYKTIFDDVQMDILKWLHVSDGYIKEENNAVGLSDLKLYLVKKNKEGEVKARQDKQTPFVESIHPNKEITCSIHFDIHTLYQLKNRIETGDYIIQGRNQVWVGMREKVKQIFGFDLKRLPDAHKYSPEDVERLLQKRARKVIRHIANCVKVFSKRQMEKDLQWLDHFQRFDEDNHYTSKIQQGLSFYEDTNQATFLHLGYGTGFIGTTALLYFLEDAGLKEAYEAIIQTFRIGKRPKGAKIDMQHFPKSRRWANTSESIQPLGWLQIQSLR